ncbi:hypothetical protein [Xanthovirga aplysinae]|uniref:hypothetical protein n=1 Tax=Xanthovirga aplysinae TaxID=2529853 RepID=UPI0012BBE64B|nr:hypothetical protein [Xanthovirga aplysinae]MTI33505.1 hypothetical protein [Xanthovirga aplysinae]
MSSIKFSFIHTSHTHVKRFKNVLRRYSGVQASHFVDEELLGDILLRGEIGKDHELRFKGLIKEVNKTYPQLVICTCSTLGQIISKGKGMNNVVGLDQPMIETCIEKHQKVVVAYTLKSTVFPTLELIAKTAKALNKPVEIIECFCEKAWEYFPHDVDQYLTKIKEALLPFIQKGDAIILAQASMGGVKQMMSTDKPLYSSDEIGIDYYVRSLMK